MAHPEIAFPSPRRRRGISGFPAFLALIFILALFPIGLYVLAPWNYYTGGHFHVLPWWNGVARFNAPASGGEYSLFFTVAPSLSHYRDWDMNGTAFLCTPLGERIAFLMGGDFPKGTYKELNGVPIRMRLVQIKPSKALTGNYGSYLDLEGAFDHSNLVVHDNGSFNRAFRADGSPYPNAPMGAGNEKITFTVQEKPLSATAPACGAPRP